MGLRLSDQGLHCPVTESLAILGIQQELSTGKVFLASRYEF